MSRATPRQTKALQNFGLTAPPTKAGCHNLLNFILECHWRKMDKADRIAYAITTQQRWLGEHVLVNGKDSGVIDYMTCQSFGHLRVSMLMGTDNEESPFRFHVCGDNGKGLGLKSIMALEVIEP